MPEFDENENFRFSVCRTTEQPETKQSGLVVFPSEARAYFQCECENCILSALAVMSNFVNAFQKKHGITDEQLLQARKELITGDELWKVDRPQSSLN